MDYWPQVGTLGILSLWGAIALVPWFALLIARRGDVRLRRMPVVVAAGIGAGALTPALAGKGWLGFEISLLAALVASAAACAVATRGMATDGHR
jgi:prepilin signal peptidase PulO-like enzyme (type II secretory pathway)